MCVYSMIADDFLGRYRPMPIPVPTPVPFPVGPSVKDLFDLAELLRKAKEYDRLHGQPDCELDEKRQALKKLADELGVEVIFP